MLACAAAYSYPSPAAYNTAHTKTSRSLLLGAASNPQALVMMYHVQPMLRPALSVGHLSVPTTTRTTTNRS